MINDNDRWFEVDNDGEPLRVFYSVHTGWAPDLKKELASVDLDKTNSYNSHSYVSLNAVCEIANCLRQLNEELGKAP